MQSQFLLGASFIPEYNAGYMQSLMYYQELYVQQHNFAGHKFLALHAHSISTMSFGSIAVNPVLPKSSCTPAYIIC